MPVKNSPHGGARQASQSLSNEADIAKVQEWLGHANVSTTRLYDLSNNDRRKILKDFGMGAAGEVGDWEDRQLDEKLLELRTRLQGETPSAVLDFYEPPLKERWSRDQIIKTVEGEVTVTVPTDEDESDDKGAVGDKTKTPEARHSIQIQAKLARIGAVMGFKIWIPRSDRGRVSNLLQAREQAALLEDLPLNFDDTTMYTIEQIDVLWLRGRAIYHAFEVEQTTACVFGSSENGRSTALQPNIWTLSSTLSRRMNAARRCPTKMKPGRYSRYWSEALYPEGAVFYLTRAWKR